MQRLAWLALLALSALPGCSRLTAAEPEPAAQKAATGTRPKAKPKLKAVSHAEKPDQARRYIVPFAWEASNDEPLSQTRSFLKEILTDNRVYMEHGPRFFAGFADGQKPRATVVTCADSRVHTVAFDTTPENDDFMIRNIGNQVSNAEGSVEYGVEHLETPVLLILGHTGCGAVKAAMGDLSPLSEPVRRELEKLDVPKPKQGVDPNAAWSEAVVVNVRNQVTAALGQFGSRIREGKLTVVGAVYDFRNDLGHGPGKLTIVDVNGNGEPARMEAFVQAVEGDAPVAKRKAGAATDRASGKRVAAAPAVLARKLSSPSDEAVVDALGQIPGLVVHKPPASPTQKTAARTP